MSAKCTIPSGSGLSTGKEGGFLLFFFFFDFDYEGSSPPSYLFQDKRKHRDSSFI